MSRIYSQLKDRNKRLEMINLALKVDPDSLQALTEACKFYLAEHNYGKAYGLYLSLRALYPNGDFVKIISKKMELEMSGRR